MVLTSYIALNRIAASPISGKADRDESLGLLNYGQHTIGSAEVDASVSFVMPGFLGGAFLECVFGVDNFKRSSKPALLNSRAKTAFSYNILSLRAYSFDFGLNSKSRGAMRELLPLLVLGGMAAQPT